MKRILLVLTLIAGLKVAAQNLNVAVHNSIDEVGNMVTIGSKHYYAEVHEYGCCGREMLIYGLDNAAQTTLWHAVSSSTVNWPYLRKLVKTADNCMVLWGGGPQDCDVGGNYIFFIKLDTLGNKLFETVIDLTANPSFNVVDLVAYSDSSYYFVTGSLLLHYSKTGAFIANYTTGMTQINNAAMLANGHLLLSGVLNNVVSNVEMTVTGTLIGQQPGSAGAIVKMTETGTGELYARNSLGLLVHYDASHTLQNTGTVVVNDFTVRNDSVFAAGTTAAGPFYSIYNSTLGLLYTTQQPYHGVAPVSIALCKGRVSILTQDVSGTQQNVTFKGIYQMPLAGTFASQSDIGVRGFSISSYTLYASLATTGTLAINGQYNLNVTVRNFGSDTVHSFYLSDYITNPYCNNLFHRYYTSTIAPHDSVVVQTGDIYEWPFYIPSTTPQSALLPVHFCFFSTVPNASNDIAIFNDSKCDSVFVPAIFTGIQQLNVQEVKVSIVPNPFGNTLQVEAGIAMKKIEICDLLGRLQRQIQVNDKQMSLNTGDLPSGVYFVKIDTDKGSVVQKVIRE